MRVSDLQMQDLAVANEQRVETWRDFLDLTVALVVELGRTKMNARQILELEPNAIVKLSRAAGEGVDVLAGNRVLARGEIVVVEDRAHIRLSDIRSIENR